MDTRFIKTLLTVVELGSFSGAARRENLTPAAVAQRIRRLEAQLGHSLVTRSGQRVAPTPKCLSVLPGLQKIVAEMRRVSTDLDITGLGGPIRLGAISTALSDHIPSVLAQFAKHAPTASLSLSPGTSKELYAKLLNGEVDATFVVRPPFTLPKSVAQISIETQPMVMIVCATDQRPLTEIIAAERALLYDPQSWGGGIAEAWIKSHVPHEKILCELDALETIAIAVGQGLGYSIIPNWRGLANFASVRRLSLPTLNKSRELVFLHRQLKDPILRLFKQAGFGAALT
jgi:DNA-binding transcriptional LysR family regulator